MKPSPGFRAAGIRHRSLGTLLVLWAWLTVSGCAAFHPIKGVPARYLPEEYRGTSRAGKRTIDLSLLKQTPPSSYLVDTGDVLGIYIEGVLGDRKLVQPVNIPLTNDAPPSFGYPIPVRDDGTISLPLVGSVMVRGLTIPEVEAKLKDNYTTHKQFLNPENDRILVSLQKPRQYRVLVIRQEAGQPPTAMPGFLNAGTLKRGTGQVVSLPAYKNDVLHALAQTGGLPGLDAENAIYVIRRRKTASGWTPIPGTSLPSAPTPIPAEVRRGAKPGPVARAQSSAWNQGTAAGYTVPTADAQGDYRRSFSGPYSTPPTGNRFAPELLAQQPAPSPAPLQDSASTPPPLGPVPNGAPLTPAAPVPHDVPGFGAFPTMTPEQFGWDLADGEFDGRRIIRIPVRLGPGETVDLQESDIILEDGDIIFIESRDTEVFYTGGLLNSGQFTLPRDYDLNVLQAIAISHARQSGSGGTLGTSSIGGQSALNNDVTISASNLIILRYLPDGRMIPIEVDLYKARTDVAEQVIIQPGDYLLLQYKKSEAILAFIERHLLAGALFGIAGAQLNQRNN